MSRATAVAFLASLGVVACGQQPPPPPSSSDAAPRRAADSDGSVRQQGGGGAAAELVRLSSKAVERSGIRVGEVTRGRVSAVVEAPAEIHLIHERVAHVSPLVPGRLRDVKVHRGEAVEAGQVLGVLSCVQLGEARARLAKAAALLEVAQSDFDRQKRLRDDRIAAERAVIEAQAKLREARAERDAAKAHLAVFRAGGGSGPDMPLKSPIEGRVVELNAVRGETVGPDSKLFVVADLSEVMAVGKVYEQDLANVRVGMEAELTLRAYPDRTFHGEVAFVPCALDTETRSLGVRVKLDNSEGILRRGLFGSLKLREAPGSAPDGGAAGRRVPVVPQDAVQQIGDRSLVFVPTGEEGVFRAVTVVTGARAEENVEVLDGLAAGDRVVVAGAFVLKSQLLRGELEE